jgi:hypothetical protein
VRLSPDQRAPIQQTNLELGLAATLPPIEGNRWLLTRDFSLIWWSQVLSQVADGVSRLALLWFVYSVTGSALKTSIVGLLQTLPPIVLGPLIGVSVDRLPKKAILIGTDVTRGILIGAIPCWLSVQVFTVDMLYLLVFLYGIATAMFVPTLSSSVPFLVDRPRFVAANALLQSTTSIGIIIGPVLSGLGIAFSGSQDVLCANALIYFASALCLVPIRLLAACCRIRTATRSPRRYRTSRRDPVCADLSADHPDSHSDGVPVHVRVRRLHDAVSVFGKDAGLGPGGGRVSLVLARHWLVSGLARLVLLTQWDTRKRIQVVWVSSVIGGAALCALVWTQDLVMATLLVVIIGMGFGTWTPIAWGMIQEFSPAHLVGGSWRSTRRSQPRRRWPAWLFRWMTERFNEHTSVIGIGVVLFLLALAAAWFSRRVTDAGNPADVSSATPARLSQPSPRHDDALQGLGVPFSFEGALRAMECAGGP